MPQMNNNNKMSKTITLAALSAFAVTPLSAVNVVYDWSTSNGNQGLLGWSNLQVDTTAGNFPNPGSATSYEFYDRGLELAAPLFGLQDAVHDTLVAQSPSFTLSGGSYVSEIAFGLDSGANPGSLPANMSLLPTTTSTNGFVGLALIRLSDGAYLLEAGKAANGGNTESFVWDSAELATAISGDASGTTYALQLIDYKHGGWGHVGLESVTLTVVPEPSQTALLGMGAAMLLIRRKRTR